jgi:acetyl-CoA C-acetyltransferase
MFAQGMAEWLSKWYGARRLTDRLKLLPQFRLQYLAPVMVLLKGLTDPINGLSMGQTAEELAYRFAINRQQMDQYAVTSHQRLVKAQIAGYFDNEVTTIYDNKGNFYEQDDGVRPDSSMEKLATLPPFFDKKFGQVTAGNSSQVSDGAAFLMLASEDAVKRYQLPVMGRIVDCSWAGVDPRQMGLGPVHAIAPLLQRHLLKTEDIAFWEINEAFAVQVLACLKAWECTDYSKEELGLNQAFSPIDLTRLNVDGGAIALGHPVGASGARLVLHLLHTLKREGGKYGVASLCIGGGQGGAMLVENVSEVQ